MQIQIARIDKCEKPSYVVGFAIQHPSGKSVYLDAFVPLESEASECSQEAVVQRAYESITPSVEAFRKECDANAKSVVGKRFDPETKSIL